jgi:putative holliday junction resolvase
MISNYLALDVGRVRIGLATGNTIARLASPFATITNDEQVLATLQAIIRERAINELVIGLPRGLEGQETSQTAYVHDFVKQLQSVVNLPIHLQDEALTSVKAEEELERRGKPYQKGDIDALSAVFILEDYLQEGVH